MNTKNYLKLMVIITVLSVLSSCSKSNDLQRFFFTGNVKSCLEKHYEVEKRFGEWEAVNMYLGVKTEFNENGLYLYQEFFMDERLVEKIIPKRENGKIIEEITYDEDGKLFQKRVYTHNSKDETESVIYYKNGKEKEKVKQRFENNRIVEDGYITYEYDKNGNLINMNVKKYDDSVGRVTFKYLLYDEKGNWVKRLTYHSDDNDEPIEIIIREIEYF